MSDTPEIDQIILSRDEYNALARGAVPTVTVPADEYAALVAFKASGATQSGDYTRVLGRLRELETILRREQQDHDAELAGLHKRIKQLGG